MKPVPVLTSLAQNERGEMPNRTHDVFWNNKELYRCNKENHHWEKRVQRTIRGLGQTIIAVSQLNSRISRAAEDLISPSSYLEVDESGEPVIKIEGWSGITAAEACVLYKELAQEYAWRARLADRTAQLVSQMQEQKSADSRVLSSLDENDMRRDSLLMSVRSAKHNIEISKATLNAEQKAAERWKDMLESLVMFCHAANVAPWESPDAEQVPEEAALPELSNFSVQEARI